jgi:hypothetical protein
MDMQSLQACNSLTVQDQVLFREHAASALGRRCRTDCSTSIAHAELRIRREWRRPVRWRDELSVENTAGYCKRAENRQSLIVDDQRTGRQTADLELNDCPA